MAEYNVGADEQGDETLHPSKVGSKIDLERTRQEKRAQEHEDQLSYASGNLLDRADTFIYAAVGISFLLGSVVALIYTFWEFGASTLWATKPIEPNNLASAIITFVSGLLLVLIITEVLGTVIHYLKSHETTLRPFLFIGIVSATRSILSVGARLSVAEASVSREEFTHAMIELGVSAAVVLALGITLKILENVVDIGSRDD